MEWQHHIADVILETERGLPRRRSKEPTPAPSQEGNKTSARSGMLPSSGEVGGGFGAAEGLISQNIANNKAKVANPHPAISIFNFHYAHPPTTVALNYGLNKVIGDNETGFRGTNDLPYRVEAWSFILAGGALFNNLDYSFVAGSENGSYVGYPAKQPGGGNPSF